ncbi:hypothetical protein JB92DRAFT_161558 [Gautieria morchelliformis]|nr:hypothetical protein JB92DRAFT_161558 [Gautieria morchelliformis]
MQDSEDASAVPSAAVMAAPLCDSAFNFCWPLPFHFLFAFLLTPGSSFPLSIIFCFLFFLGGGTASWTLPDPVVTYFYSDNTDSIDGMVVTDGFFFFMESDTARQKESIALFFMILGIFFRGGQIFGVLNTKIAEIQKSARRILSRKINCACFHSLWLFMASRILDARRRRMQGCVLLGTRSQQLSLIIMWRTIWMWRDSA